MGLKRPRRLVDSRRDILVADLAVWRRERLCELPEGHKFDVMPDWICEVLSPGTARLDRAIKRPLYSRYRVGHLWLVDALAPQLVDWWV